MATGSEPQLSKGNAARERGKTLIVLVLDSSGSMATVLDDTIGGYNVYIQNEQASFDAAEKFFLSVIFNGTAIRMIPAAPIAEVLPLDRTTYVPASSTPLYDAIGKAIREADAYIAAHPGFVSSETDQRVLVAIITDGQENASREYTRTQIFDLLTEKQAKGWGVVYLGANQDAFTEANQMGIAVGGTSNLSVRQMRQVSQVLSQATFRHRSGQAELVDDEQRRTLTEDEDQQPPN